MPTIIQTETYRRWFAALRDDRARARINVRLRRIELGVLGDCKPIGEGVSEARIDFGPGYRVYFVRRGYEVIILLAGGDKATQARDIKSALKLARDL
ncbi:type II toxin-antitoxin system RelE/ParE family toxin [Pseudomonas sp. NPDC008258]|uniref:type II toxin-antitoxin system RelE/ParE family toxin n=1 Tax=Pseudomonas sp. NPDC008258 TaxID=3364418 RepID=UPI0036E42D4C